MREIFDFDNRETEQVTQIPNEESERERIERRARMRAQMRREKELQAKRRRIASILVPVCLAMLICIFGLVKLVSFLNRGLEKSKTGVAESSIQAVRSEAIPQDYLSKVETNVLGVEIGGPGEEIGGPGTEAGTADSPNAGDVGEAALSTNIVPQDQSVYSAFFSESTDGVNEEEVTSKYVILLELNTSEVLACKEAKTRINPASMTKILTLLTAADYVKDLDDTFKMTIDITDYSYSHDCSAVGFARDEVVTVRDLLYGTILPSGGDAAVGLATYVAGSHEAFVELMNKKLESLGLAGSSHMTNCVGIFHENHYSTVYDIAMILEAAINNELCKEVLRAHTYVTSQTLEHPDGITISNWFLRRIEDKDTHGEVICAKTGFVAQSGCCAASYATDEPGNGFICVTADAHSSWRAIYDHVALYQRYL